MNSLQDKILVSEFGMLNTSTPPDFFQNPGKDGKNIANNFKKRLRLENFQKTDPNSLEFDLIGVDPSFTNMIRRVLISEVPSMAIEKVFIFNNTSIIQDEVLAHRLGLIPVKADPRLFKYKASVSASEGGGKSDDELLREAEGSPQDTIVFELKIRCKRGPNAAPKSKDPSSYVDTNVYSKSIKPLLRAGQSDDIGMICDDILIAKMRPGHELDLKLYAVKGVGKDHAKFSPVCTAFYRLLPEIKLLKPITGEAASRLQSCFSPGVIGIRTGGSSGNEAFVKNARYDACSRNVFRHEDLKDCVELTKKRDHFIFTIESVGALAPNDLFSMAMDIIVEKCDYFIEILNKNSKDS